MDNPEAHQEMKQIKTAKKSEQHESYRKHGKWNQVLAENKQFLFLIRNEYFVTVNQFIFIVPQTKQ
jgi:hypothetical protein